MWAVYEQKVYQDGRVIDGDEVDWFADKMRASRAADALNSKAN
jgi:hypothetical protein